MRRASALVLLGALWACPAAAQPGEADTEGSDDQARALFELGQSAFEDGRYDDALGYFERAHALSGRPELVFNIGSSLERLGRTRDAVDAYRRFLDELPDAPNRSIVEEKIAVLERSLAHESEPGPAPEPEDGSASLGVWPWIVVGAGALLGGGAGLFWWAALDAESSLATGCGATLECGDADISSSNGPTYVTLTNVFLTAAIATLALGVTLVVIDLAFLGGDDSETNARLHLGPTTVLLTGNL